MHLPVDPLRSSVAPVRAGWRVALLWLGLVTLPVQAQTQAADTDAAYFRRASSCAAVLKQDVLALRDRFGRGEAAVRGEILRLTEHTFAFVGIAFKRGLRNPQADQLLEEAERQQQRLPPAALRQLSSDCQSEGARLLTASNAVERALVRNRAKARVEQLLNSRAS